MAEVAVPLNGGLLLSLVIGVPMTVLGILLAPWMFSVLILDPEVIAQGVPYLQWRLVAVAAVGMNFAFRGYWSAIKQTRVYMMTLVVMHLLNVSFSYTLIHGLWGLPALGTAGAGLGTTLSIFCGTAFYFVYASRHARPMGFLRGGPSRSEIQSLTRLGLPSAVQQLLFSGGFTVMFWMIGQVGTTELAVAHVLITLTLTIVLPGIAFGIAAATLASQSLGRGDPEDAYRVAWETFRIALLPFLGLAFPMVFFPDALLAVFLTDPVAIDVGRVPLQLIGLMMTLDGLGIILMQALLGAGASRQVMTVSVLLQWGLFLPLVWLLGPILGGGLTAIWLAMGGYRLLQTGLFVHAWQRRQWVAIKL